jgi:hypothetical protein
VAYVNSTSAATYSSFLSGHDIIRQQVLIHPRCDRVGPSRLRQPQEGRFVFDAGKWVSTSAVTYMLTSLQAGTYTEFIPVFANVFLGMQLALSSYLQVCFCITNDVVMSISLMYEQPESGEC